MPSKVHDGLVHFLRNRPTLAVELLTDSLNISLPSHTATRLESEDCTDVSPTEYRADTVIVLDGPDRPAAAIVAEIQLRPDRDKRFSWPVYLATLRGRLRCPAYLLVITPSRRTATWCAEPIDCGHPDWILRPVVLGPDHIPEVTDPTQAVTSPELAMLSAMSHGGQATGRKTLDAAIAAIINVDRDRGRVYYDIVLAALPKAARRYLESQMTIVDYEFQSEFARRNQAKGKAEGEAQALLTVLSTRGLAVSDAARKRILSCSDLGQLEAWLKRSLTISTADELFV